MAVVTSVSLARPFVAATVKFVAVVIAEFAKLVVTIRLAVFVTAMSECIAVLRLLVAAMVKLVAVVIALLAKLVTTTKVVEFVLDIEVRSDEFRLLVAVTVKLVATIIAVLDRFVATVSVTEFVAETSVNLANPLVDKETKLVTEASTAELVEEISEWIDTLRSFVAETVKLVAAVIAELAKFVEIIKVAVLVAATSTNLARPLVAVLT